MSGVQEADSDKTTRVIDAETLVGSASGPALALDGDDVVVYWNEGVGKLVGLDERAAVGQAITQLLDPLDIFGNAVIQMGHTFFETVIRGQALRRFEVNLRTESGERFRVEVSVVVVVGATPAAHRFVLYLTPIRRRRRADEAIERLLAQSGSPDGAVALGEHGRISPARPRLTERQHEVLCLLALGSNVNQIASDLGISIHTVRNHVQSILRAFESQSQLEAVTKAMAAGYLTRRTGGVGDRRDES